MNAILLDADGVTIKKHEFFSDKFAREYKIPLEKIIPFFHNEFKLCQLGQADLKESLVPYLEEWGWQKSIDEFLQYWFESDTVADEQVLEKVQELRSQNVKCYLVTDQEKYRAECICKNLRFDQKFDGCFFSYEIGFSKSQTEFFTEVLIRLNLEANTLMYLDDDEKNLESAKQLGINVKLYKNLNNLTII